MAAGLWGCALGPVERLFAPVSGDHAAPEAPAEDGGGPTGETIATQGGSGGSISFTIKEDTSATWSVNPEGPVR